MLERYKHIYSCRRRGWAFYVTIFVLLYWSTREMNLTFGLLVRGFPNIFHFVAGFFPPDFLDWRVYLTSAVQTLKIAFLGTSIATVAALPLSFFAINIYEKSRFSILAYSVKFIFNLCRGTSELILGLLFVAAFGLGPFSGVMALAVHEIGALGRYFAETIENTGSSIVDIGRSVGATKLQIVTRMIMPEVMPYLIGYVIYYFEHSIRSATVLGLVGAGGIGFLLVTRIKLFRYHEVSSILIVIIFFTIVSDILSASFRKRLNYS
jgi:phosphonate transport system permease protein